MVNESLQYYQRNNIFGFIILNVINVDSNNIDNILFY